jgi:hypothetical protein
MRIAIDYSKIKKESIEKQIIQMANTSLETLEETLKFITSRNMHTGSFNAKILLPIIIDYKKNLITLEDACNKVEQINEDFNNNNQYESLLNMMRGS